MRPLTSMESTPDVDSFSRNLTTEPSVGPRAVATSGERPEESAASALLTADSISAFHSPLSTLAEASSGISSNPFAAAQSVWAAVTPEIDPETATIWDSLDGWFRLNRALQ